MDNMKLFHEEFAAKMWFPAFINMFRQYVEKIPHGFICINNDPNITYDEKFYYGLAEELPFDLEHILGCQESWADSLPQLYDIGSGKMNSKIERISKISKPLECAFDTRDKVKDSGNGSICDVDDRKFPTWDTRGFRPRFGSKKHNKLGPIL